MDHSKGSLLHFLYYNSLLFYIKIVYYLLKLRNHVQIQLESKIAYDFHQLVQHQPIDRKLENFCEYQQQHPKLYPVQPELTYLEHMDQVDNVVLLKHLLR